MVNSENISGINMQDEIPHDALKILKGEIAIIIKKLKDEVRSVIGYMDGEFVLFKEKVNDKIEAAENTLKMVSMMNLKK